MKLRTLGWLTGVLVVATIVWVGTTIATEALAPPTPTLTELNVLFYVTYINAALITLLTGTLFAGLYLYLRQRNELWAIVALVFIPVYIIGNLVAYVSQILVVPHLLELYRRPETAGVAELLLGLTLQNWPGSAIGALNLLSYAVLGIPSIIFGLLLARCTWGLRAAGMLLALSGLLSILALIGLGLNIPALTALTLVSGGFFLIALILLSIHLLRDRG